MRAFMHCPCCGAEVSAAAADYWWIADNRPFECGECGEPMQLVRRVVTYEVLAEVVTMDTLEKWEGK